MSIRRLVVEPRGAELALAAALLLLADWLYRRAGDSFLPGGPLDESAHLLTMLLIVWAMPAALAKRIAVPALIASVAIDADHIPQYLGLRFLTVGTPRPYTHSLLTIAVLLVTALAARKPNTRRILIGVVVGIVFHFWRDLSESDTGIALLWPFSDTVATLPHWSYLAGMAGVVAFDGAKLVTAPRRMAAPSPTG